MTRAPYLIAIDAGTRSVRAGLFRANGELVSVASMPIELLHPADEQAVYRMDAIFDAVCGAVAGAVEGQEEAASGVVALAVDATSSTYVGASGGRALDGDADVICWMDHRAEAEAEEIDATGDRYLDHVGGAVSSEMHLPKLLWLKRHRPEAWVRVEAVRDLADEIARRLTGIDRHSVCGLACKWPYLPADPEPWRRGLLTQLGLGGLLGLGALAQRPGRVGEVHGGLKADVAARIGLPPGSVVAVGLIDAEAGALGVLGRGFRESMNRTLALIGGTSTCYMSWAQDERRIRGVWGPFRDAVFADSWMHEAGQSFSGGALDAVLEQHPAGPRTATAEHHAQTVREIEQALAREGDSFASRRHIVPDWLGNRSPFGDGSMRALASGIGLETGRRAFLEQYYATARALALQSRQVREHLNAHGYAIDRVCLAGGHLRNPLLVSLYRDALGCGVAVTDAPEPVLLGTAMVAAVAGGLQPDLYAALDAMAPSQTLLHADPAASAGHESSYRLYLRLAAMRNEIEAEARYSVASSPLAAGAN